MYRVRQGNLVIWKVNKRKSISHIDVIRFLSHCTLPEFLFQVVLKITSDKWWPSFAIHWSTRFLKFCSTLSSISTEMLAIVVLQVLQGPWFVIVNNGFEISPKKEVAESQIGGARRPQYVTPQRDEALVFPQKSHWSSRCVCRGSVLLEPYVPKFHFFNFWEKKCLNQFSVAKRIHSNSVFFLEKIRSNYRTLDNAHPTQ